MLGERYCLSLALMRSAQVTTSLIRHPQSLPLPVLTAQPISSARSPGRRRDGKANAIVIELVWAWLARRLGGSGAR